MTHMIADGIGLRWVYLVFIICLMWLRKLVFYSWDLNAFLNSHPRGFLKIWKNSVFSFFNKRDMTCQLNNEQTKLIRSLSSGCCWFNFHFLSQRTSSSRGISPLLTIPKSLQLLFSRSDYLIKWAFSENWYCLLENIFFFNLFPLVSWWHGKFEHVFQLKMTKLKYIVHIFRSEDNKHTKNTAKRKELFLTMPTAFKSFSKIKAISNWIQFSRQLVLFCLMNRLNFVLPDVIVIKYDGLYGPFKQFSHKYSLRLLKFVEKRSD